MGAFEHRQQHGDQHTEQSDDDGQQHESSDQVEQLGDLRLDHAGVVLAVLHVGCGCHCGQQRRDVAFRYGQGGAVGDTYERKGID